MGNQKPTTKGKRKNNWKWNPCKHKWLNCFGLAQSSAKKRAWSGLIWKWRRGLITAESWTMAATALLFIYLFHRRSLNANVYSHTWTEWKTNGASVPGSEVTTPVVIWSIHKVGFIFFTSSFRLWCECDLSLIKKKHKPCQNSIAQSGWRGFLMRTDEIIQKRNYSRSITEKVLMCVCGGFICDNLGHLDPTPTSFDWPQRQRSQGQSVEKSKKSKPYFLCCDNIGFVYRGTWILSVCSALQTDSSVTSVPPAV